MAEAEEIFYLRMILEPSIAATTAIQASPEDHQHVNSLLKALEQSGADMRIGMEVRRNLMLSMLKQPNRPTTTKLVSQLFDRSERYHYGEVTEGFLDIPGLKEVIRSWLSVDIEALKHHYARRIAGRLECARVALS
jgi:DNA-binding GntR family transcriptional regulator